MIKDKRTTERRVARARRVRAKVSGTATRPRLSVFRSLKSFSVQAIDDTAGKTLSAVTLKHVGAKAKNSVASAGAMGELLAEQLKKNDITEAVLDRRGYKYHGKVKAFTDGVREKGVKI